MPKNPNRSAGHWRWCNRHRRGARPGHARLQSLLVEQRDLSHGTTGRNYHGLLHSGGRYAIKDPEAAVNVSRENTILRRIMPHCLEDTGGCCHHTGV